jgi:hypothetical protein
MRNANTSRPIGKDRTDALRQYLEEWEQKHGKLTEQELAQATKELETVRERLTDGSTAVDVDLEDL